VQHFVLMQCKNCKFSHSDPEVLLKHYRLRHGQGHQGRNWPCLYPDCVCSFRTSGALKSHLTRYHTKSALRQINTTFKCELCEFKTVCSESRFFSHLGGHLRSHDTVRCPFTGCEYNTNKLTNFATHRSRKHKTHTTKDLRTSVITEDEENPGTEDEENPGAEPIVDFDDIDAEPSSQAVQDSETDLLDCEVDSETLEHKLASLFLCMQTVLHISKSAIRKIIEELRDILYFSKFLALNTIKDILVKHKIDTDLSILQEITNAIFETNPLLLTTSEKGSLSTDHRRNSYFKEHFSVLEPTEYLYDRTRKNHFVYVSVYQVLERLLSHPGLLDKIVFNQQSPPGHFESFQDGHYFKENRLLGDNNLGIALGLYIDEFEVCNPLGTSRKIHKTVAVYWVVLNLPAKFRSGLHSIQLAVLGKSDDVRLFGYEKFLDPLMKDLKCLEQTGVFVPALSQYLKGTVFCVSADNLGAHSLAGFQESFNVEKIKSTEVSDFKLRTTEQHNYFVEEVQNSDILRSVNGVKRECVLSKHLSFFHPITGFPPDALHDLFEGIVPIELSVCLKDLISKGFISYDELNSCIKSFPYKDSDRVNKPKVIAKSSFAKGTVGGNGHENWALLRLLPLMIGRRIPENEPSWEILMDLKAIVELVVSAKFSEETLCYLESKISDHRHLLTETFPDLTLRPKHHFVDHYPQLIRCFGPLVSLWTMRFEAKHSYFKKIVHDTHNFKNVLLTLATKHQQMVAYYHDGDDLFKQSLYVEKVKVFRISSFEAPLKSAIERKYPDASTVSLSTDIHLHGVRYMAGMIISAGQCSGLPEFYKILNCVVAPNEVSFLCKKLSAWYLEHFRSFEIQESHFDDVYVLDLDMLNDFHPLAAYKVGTKVLVTPRVFLLH